MAAHNIRKEMTHDLHEMDLVKGWPRPWLPPVTCDSTPKTSRSRAPTATTARISPHTDITQDRS